jgi:hypothetical protein
LDPLWRLAHAVGTFRTAVGTIQPMCRPTVRRVADSSEGNSAQVTIKNQEGGRT